MKILIILITLGVLCLLFILIESYFENRKLNISQYKITSSKIPKEFDGYRIAFLSDLHNNSFGEENEKLVEEINIFCPDCILVGGDMLVGKPESEISTPIQLLNSLAKKYPIYYGRGNHELRVASYEEDYGTMWEDYKNALDSKICWLLNHQVYIEKDGKKIALFGLDLSRAYYRRFQLKKMDASYMDQVLKNNQDKETIFSILLAHNPDYFPEYAKWGADLVLSGHIHGGMIRLPWLGGLLSPMVRFFPKYDKGLFQEGTSKMIVSGGLGNHTFKFRVNNLPDLVLIELKSM